MVIHLSNLRRFLGIRIPLIIIILWIVTTVFPYPLRRNAVADIRVLAFADVLEQLEFTFYTQALGRFNASNFLVAGFASPQIPIQQIKSIASDEGIHAITLKSAIYGLGGQVVSNCTFNFSSALTDVNTMVATARVVENVGVSAYLGALAVLEDPVLVTAASSILTVEARHQTILNLLSNATSIPQPFDIALAPADVLAIAGTFVSGCQLGFSANPPLTVANNSALQAGMRLSFNSPVLNGTIPENQLSCKIVTGGLNASLYQPIDDCMVPVNVTGPMYVFITKHYTQMPFESPSNTNSTKHSSLVVAGPALLFINQPDLIGSLVRPGHSTTDPKISNYTAEGSTPFLTTSKTVVSPTTGTPAAQTTVPPSGVYTTTISPAEASILLSALTN